MPRFFTYLLICLFSNGLCATSEVNVQLCRGHHSSVVQQWQYVRDDHSIRPMDSQLCLTTHANQSSSVTLSTCVTGLNFYQVWSLNPQGGEIVALNGKCLGAHHRKLLRSSVEITPCTGEDNQHWIWMDINGGLLQNKWLWKRCLTAVK
jgi:hypothetical protein